MKAMTHVWSRAVALPVDNIDTDQIIPARFLKVTDKEGLGDALFADWRYDARGKPEPDFVLNQPQAKGARILVAGANFGCGSSREHAPWALAGFGFQAVVSTRFADIFQNNALKNGLLPIRVEPDIHAHILSLIEENPYAHFHADVGACTFGLPDATRVRFPIDPFARHCLVHGQDELTFLLAQEDSISRLEVAREATPDGAFPRTPTPDASPRRDA